MDAETNLFRITQRCSGLFDSRAERGNDHNPHGCQMTDELGVMQKTASDQKYMLLCLQNLADLRITNAKKHK